MHLVDATMFFAPESGGVKRYLLAKREWIARHTDIRHTLLVPGPQTDPSGGLVTVPAPPLPFSRGYRFPLRAEPWEQRLRALAPDVIEAGDPYRVAWAALRAGSALGAPVVGFYHSDLERLLADRIGGWTRRYTRSYLQRLYGSFDLVLAPSGVMASKLQELGIERAEVQPLGVDARLFHPARRDTALRERLGIAPQTRLLVFAGRFSKEKNLDALVQAVRRLGRGYHLLLIGGERRGRPEPNVSVLPYQGDGQVLAGYLASCDALVHAGDSETFGLVIAEAMACGLPVLGVDAAATPELVDAAVGQLVPDARAATLAAGIEALCRRDLGRLGRQARARVESRYAWGQVLQLLVRRYARLAGCAEQDPDWQRAHA